VLYSSPRASLYHWSSRWLPRQSSASSPGLSRCRSHPGVASPGHSIEEVRPRLALALPVLPPSPRSRPGLAAPATRQSGRSLHHPGELRLAFGQAFTTASRICPGSGRPGQAAPPRVAPVGQGASVARPNDVCAACSCLPSSSMLRVPHSQPAKNTITTTGRGIVHRQPAAATLTANHASSDAVLSSAMLSWPSCLPCLHQPATHGRLLALAHILQVIEHGLSARPGRPWPRDRRPIPKTLDGGHGDQSLLSQNTKSDPHRGRGFHVPSSRLHSSRSPAPSWISPAAQPRDRLPGRAVPPMPRMLGSAMRGSASPRWTPRLQKPKSYTGCA